MSARFTSSALTVNIREQLCSGRLSYCAWPHQATASKHTKVTSSSLCFALLVIRPRSSCSCQGTITVGFIDALRVYRSNKVIHTSLAYLDTVAVWDGSWLVVVWGFLVSNPKYKSGPLKPFHSKIALSSTAVLLVSAQHKILPTLFQNWPILTGLMRYISFGSSTWSFPF